jgi:Tol biopolymer transport system component
VNVTADFFTDPVLRRTFEVLANDSWGIYLVSTDGGESRSLSAPNQVDAERSWSPDGTIVIFSGLSWSDVTAEKATSIRLLNLKTNERSSLPGSDGFWSPAWSPDGHFVTALTGDSKKLMIYDVKSRRVS